MRVFYYLLGVLCGSFGTLALVYANYTFDYHWVYMCFMIFELPLFIMLIYSMIKFNRKKETGT